MNGGSNNGQRHLPSADRLMQLLPTKLSLEQADTQHRDRSSCKQEEEV